MGPKKSYKASKKTPKLTKETNPLINLEDLALIEDFRHNESILQSYGYFKNLNEEEDEIIRNFRGSTDPSDIKDFIAGRNFEIAPPFYQILNYIMRMKPGREEETSDLVKKMIKKLTDEQLRDQIIQIGEIIRICKSYPKSNTNIFLYRGQDDYREVEQLRIGEILLLDSFYSTSVDKTVAERFTHKSFPTRLIRIFIPKDIHIPLPYISPGFDPGKSFEAEVLLYPGISMVYKGEKREGDIIYYEFTMVGDTDILPEISFLMENAHKARQVSDKYISDFAIEWKKEYERRKALKAEGLLSQDTQPSHDGISTQELMSQENSQMSEFGGKKRKKKTKRKSKKRKRNKTKRRSK